MNKQTKNAIVALKKIYLPKNANDKEVNDAFFLAWKKGAKGITVFRDGLKRKQVLYTGDYNTEISECANCQIYFLPKKIITR